MFEVSEALYFAQDLATHVADLLSIYGTPAVFLSVLFFGEIAVLVSFMATGSGFFSFEAVFLLSCIATLCADLFWFMAARFFPAKFARSSALSRLSAPLGQFLDRYVGQKLFLSLLFLKFFIGTRLIILVYLGRKNISLLRFLFYDILGVIFFVTVLSAIGWLFGIGLNLLPAYNLLTKALLSAIAIFFLIFLLRRSYTNYFERRVR